MRISGGLACLCALALSGLPAAAQPASTGWSLPQLMAELAEIHSASASFTEQQSNPMLTAPLISSGTLTFIAPDYIRKTTTSPAVENFVLDHGQITLTGGPGNQTHQFSVNDDPRIGGLVEGIRATLAGDLPALEKFYTPSLSGTAAKWQLRLQPKNARLAQFVAWIVISGSQNRIQQIGTAGSGGTSQMHVTEILGDAR